MNGLLNVLKPPGMTSHDVVTHMRRVLGQKRIGHGGTLDPPAAGVIVLLLGKGTRLNQFLAGMDKVYRGEITFGIKTDTLDGTGQILEQRHPRLTVDGIEEAFSKFTGLLDQVPPMVSAVKHKGKRLYQLARQGKKVDPPSRQVEVYDLKLLDFFPGEERGYPRALFKCHCSKGTYVRTLAAGIGDYLGCGGHLSFLLRTRVGSFEISKSLTLEEIEDSNDRAQFLLPLSFGVAGLPQILVSEDMVKPIANGRALYSTAVEGVLPSLNPGQLVRLERPAENLLAIATWEKDGDNGFFRPRRVFCE